MAFVILFMRNYLYVPKYHLRQNSMDKSKMPSRPVPRKNLSTGLRSIPCTFESSVVLFLDPNLRYVYELKNLLNKVFSSHYKDNLFIMVSGFSLPEQNAFCNFFFRFSEGSIRRSNKNK